MKLCLEPIHPWLFRLPAHALPSSVRTGVLAECAAGECRYQHGVRTGWFDRSPSAYLKSRHEEERRWHVNQRGDTLSKRSVQMM